MGFIPLADPRRVGAAILLVDLVSGRREGRKKKRMPSQERMGKGGTWRKRSSVGRINARGTALFTGFPPAEIDLEYDISNTGTF